MTTNEDRLRAWASVSHPLAAATELLIRAFDGKYAQPGNPWIKYPDSEAANIEFELIPMYLDEIENPRARQVLMLAASLSDLGVHAPLGALMYELDREVLDLFLAAVAHAGASHEHSAMVTGPDGLPSVERLPSLHPWPAT
jgi:hypothetical protein